MKDLNGKIIYKDKEYDIYFNFNVIQQIQDEYGTLDKWGELTNPTNDEVNAKALIFGAMCMINEGIDIKNENEGTNEMPLTLKQVGRIITELGIHSVIGIVNDTVVESTKSEEKNA